MKSLMKSAGVIHIVLASIILLMAGCIPPPPETEDEPSVSEMMSCAGKEWIKKSPFWENDQIFEAKGLAPPSPNPQDTRDNAIENAMNTLSRLYDSDVKSYSERFVHQYRDWFKNPDNAKSDELYEQLRTILNKNKLKWLKMDECEDQTTGRWWVFLYTSKANLEAAEREASLEFKEYIIEQRREEFRKKMEQQIAGWKEEDKRTWDSIGTSGNP